MEWIKATLEWSRGHEPMLWWIFAASMAVGLLTPIVVVWIVVQLPADYFIERKRRALGTWQEHPGIRPFVLIGKNLVGFILLVSGIAMLVLPGQGVLTIVVALFLINFPGKFRFERWMATRQPVWRSLNWLRRRAGRDELKRPE